MAQPMCETEWTMLKELVDGTLIWGAAVAACWPNLVANGYVMRNFGPVTEKGREAVAGRRSRSV